MKLDKVIKQHTNYGSIADFGRNTNIPTPSLYFYNDDDNAKKMPLGRAKKIADECGISLDELYDMIN